MSEPQNGEYWVLNVGGDLTVGQCSTFRGFREWLLCGDEEYFTECETENAVCLPVRKIELSTPTESSVDS